MKPPARLILLKNRLGLLVTEHLDPILLVVALLTAGRFITPPGPSWLAQLAALGVCVFISPRRAASGEAPWRSQLKQLPKTLLISAVITGGWTFLFSVPLATSAAVLGTWLLLIAATLVNWRVCVQKFIAWVQPFFAQRRLDVVLGEALLITVVLFASGALLPGLWPEARGGALALALGWVAFGYALKLGSHRLGVRHALAFGLLVSGLWGWIHLAGHWQRAHLVAILWLGGGIVVYRLILSRFGESLAENLRWIALGTVGLLFFHPFLQAGLHGTGDSLWYATMLADMLAQIHQGVFPVFSGQSIYQFNGSIYPLRVAPLFHHAGVVADLLTGMTLDPVAVLNALLFGTGVLSLATAYFSLRALLPNRRGWACALAICYVGSPGTLGLAFNTDLFMSWMTVPWVPLVFYGSVLSFRSPGYRSLLILAGSLALLWWGHTPVALWTTLVASAIQVVRLCVARPDLPALRPLFAAAAVFLLIASYPIGSVLIFPPEPGTSSTGFLGATSGSIVHFLRQVRPAVWLPLSANGRALGDFQLGYSLWIALGAAAVLAVRRRTLALVALPAAAVFLALLLNTPAGLDEPLWSAVPAFLRNTTGNWVMNRLYVIQAGLVVFGIAAVLAVIPPGDRARARAFGAIAVCAVLWTLAEAWKFSAGSRQLMRPAESGKLAILPENIQITRFAYLVFPGIPAYFTHGVTTPELEQRLFDDRGALLADNYTAAAAGVTLGSFPFDDALLAEEGFLSLKPPLTLQPGHHYLLAFDFNTKTPLDGLIQIKGATTLREYSLPAYGENASFGHGEGHSPFLALPNNSPAPQTVTVRYFPQKRDEVPATMTSAARVRLIEYQPATLPVRVGGWIPYRAQVTAPAAAWLETPRMFQRTYRASVNGQPAAFRKSAQGLVSIPVPAGESTVELRYQAPLGLSVLYWASALGILVWLIWLVVGTAGTAAKILTKSPVN